MPTRELQGSQSTRALASALRRWDCVRQEMPQQGAGHHPGTPLAYKGLFQPKFAAAAEQ